jgi:hypothetical protein
MLPEPATAETVAELSPRTVVRQAADVIFTSGHRSDMPALSADWDVEGLELAPASLLPR